MNSPIRLVILISVATLFFSCSRQVTNINKGDNLVIYPSPPDTTRIQFLTSLSNSVDVTGRRKGLSRFVLGDKQAVPIIKPYGIALDHGMMYVCDASIAGLEFIDLDKNLFFNFVPKGLGQLKMPANCAKDPGGYLYVADAARKQVVVFNEKGEYVSAFGDENEAKPTDVALMDGKIWITDANHNKIKVYEKESRKYLYSFPDSLESGEGHLYQPINLCAINGRIYVTDFGDFKVKSYTAKGEFISALGSYGNSLGQFVRPKGIAVDKEGILYVVDAGFENVQLFNKSGQLLMFFGGPYKGKGDMWLPAKVIVDYDHLKYFEKYVDSHFRLKYLVIVTNQYGPDKINIYGAVELKK